jgi:hypothetical protein
LQQQHDAAAGAQSWSCLTAMGPLNDTPCRKKLTQGDGSLTAAHCNPRAPLALLHMSVQTYVMSHCNALLTVYGRAPQRPARRLVRAVAPQARLAGPPQRRPTGGGWRRFSSKRSCPRPLLLHPQSDSALPIVAPHRPSAPTQQGARAPLDQRLHPPRGDSGATSTPTAVDRDQRQQVRRWPTGAICTHAHGHHQTVHLHQRSIHVRNCL